MGVGFRSWGGKKWILGLGLRGFKVSGHGIGQPLSLTLSFDEIQWFDVRGEVQRCDRLRRTRSLKSHNGHIHEYAFFDQSQRCTSPRTSNHRVSPNNSVNDSG